MTQQSRGKAEGMGKEGIFISHAVMQSGKAFLLESLMLSLLHF
jgi:hypothetical protein